MNDVHIGPLSHVVDSVIGEDCDFGAGTITANYRFDRKPIKMRVKGEMVSTGREEMGVVMGDDVKTGVGVLFMPGVKVGCNSWIGPNIVVYKDVPSNTIMSLKQQIRHGDFSERD